MSTPRIIFSSVLFFFVIIGAAPLVVLFGFFGIFRFHRYAEFLVAGFLFELLYGAGTWSFPVPFPMFLGVVLLYGVGEFVRARLR